MVAEAVNGNAMGYQLVWGMQEVAPLHCDLITGEELPTTRALGLRAWELMG